jgi:GPH family glycoside/pentoside/hexuronide:cation symporter
MLMSWIPSIIALVAAVVMALYPLNQQKMDEINEELDARRAREKNSIA